MKAAALTEHDPSLLAQIRECNAVYHMSFPIKRDDGTIETVHETDVDLTVVEGEVVYERELGSGAISRSWEWPPPISAHDRRSGLLLINRRSVDRTARAGRSTLGD